MMSSGQFPKLVNAQRPPRRKRVKHTQVDKPTRRSRRAV